MYKHIILSILLSLISKVSFSQETERLVAFEKAYFLEENDTTKHQLLLNKFNYYLSCKKYDQIVFQLGQRINFKYLKNEVERANFLWNYSLLSLVNHEIQYAKSYEELYVNQTRDTSIELNLLNVFIHRKEPSVLESCIENLQKFDTVFKDLRCFNTILIDPKAYTRFVRYSKFLPGLGTFLLNEYTKGITSFILTGATGYGIYQLISHKLFVNAIGVTLVYGLKFYHGNVYLTQDIIARKLKQKENDSAINCEVVFKSIMDKYPLRFK